MANGAAPDVILADLVDSQRRHDPRIRALRLESVLKRERIDHGGEHAHVVGGHAVHAGPGEARAAEDVASAEHHGHLHAHLRDLSNLRGDALEHGRIDAVILAPEQGLTG